MVSNIQAPETAQRFGRRQGLFLTSPSLAFLAALISGRGRPGAVILSEDDPSWLGYTATLAGATVVRIPQNIGERELVETLAAMRRDETRPTWGVVCHRVDSRPPLEWLTTFTENGIHGIEICMTALAGVARARPSAASFVIVDLRESEGAPSVAPSLLLTDDEQRARRVRRLCLPEPNEPGFVFDARPARNFADSAVAAWVGSVVNGTSLPFPSAGDAETGSHFQTSDPKGRSRGFLGGIRDWLYETPDAAVREFESRLEEVTRSAEEARSQYELRLAETQAGKERADRDLETALARASEQESRLSSVIALADEKRNQEVARADALQQELLAMTRLRERATEEAMTLAAQLEERGHAVTLLKGAEEQIQRESRDREESLARQIAAMREEHDTKVREMSDEMARLETRLFRLGETLATTQKEAKLAREDHARTLAEARGPAERQGQRAATLSSPRGDGAPAQDGATWFPDDSFDGKIKRNARQGILEVGFKILGRREVWEGGLAVTVLSQIFASPGAAAPGVLAVVAFVMALRERTSPQLFDARSIEGAWIRLILPVALSSAFIWGLWSFVQSGVARFLGVSGIGEVPS